MLCGDLNGMEILKKGCIVISLHTHLQAVNFQRCKHVYASCCTVLVYFSGHCGSRSVVSDSLQAMDHTVHGILQTRILEWVAVPSSRESSQPRDQTQVSHIADWLLPSEPPGKSGGTMTQDEQKKFVLQCLSNTPSPPSHRHMSCAHVIAESLPKSFKAEACVIVSKNLWELWSINVDRNRFRLHCANGHYYLLCGQVKQTGSPNRPVFSELETLPCLYFLLEEDIF